jgi:predicted GNAT superfamily acetyltransferase
VDDFEIREITDYAEMKRAVEFQRVIWGPAFSELVPAAVFWFGNRIGAVLAGAFDAKDTMVGLLFGVTGWNGSEPVHWSDMLAVHPSARGRGVGIALKRYQRERLLGDGVRIVNWTFDPLESRNAHINFARLGVTAHEYVRDCYGVSASPLHRGIGTDRLVAHWVLDSDRVRLRMEGRHVHDPNDVGELELPVINVPGDEVRLDLHDERLLLRIPADIQGLKERDEVTARRWRDQTRSVFEGYFGRGYRAVDLLRLDGESSAYLLSRRDG